MSKRAVFDEIFDAHRAGRGRELVEKMDALTNHERAELIEYYESLNRANEVPDLMKSYFNIKGNAKD